MISMARYSPSYGEIKSDGQQKLSKPAWLWEALFAINK